MEDDIQNYLSTVMFRGTPCTLQRRSLPLSLLVSTSHGIDLFRRTAQLYFKHKSFNLLMKI